MVARCYDAIVPSISIGDLVVIDEEDEEEIDILSSLCFILVLFVLRSRFAIA